MWFYLAKWVKNAAVSVLGLTLMLTSDVNVIFIDLNTSKQQKAFSSLTIKEFRRNRTCLLVVFLCLMAIKSLLNASFCVCDVLFFLQLAS